MIVASALLGAIVSLMVFMLAEIRALRYESEKTVVLLYSLIKLIGEIAGIEVEDDSETDD